MNRRISGITTAGVLLMAALMVFALPVGVAAGAPATPGAGSGGTGWAYGIARTIAFSGSTSDGWSYVGQATYGYSVILNQTNTSATTFELSATRVMGAVISIELCLPKCNSPGTVDTANFTYHAWESSGEFANFTSAGSVTEGATSVPAIALLNSHSFSNDSLVENSSSDLAGTLRSKALTAASVGDAEINFSTPLGLVPLSLAPGTSQSWSSASEFTASASSAWTYTLVTSGPLVGVKTVGPVSGSENLSGTGNVSVAGRATAGQQVTLGGVAFPAVVLTVTGPFAVREGVIFVPSSTNLFAGSAEPWSGNQSGGATAQMTYLDIRPNADGHIGLGGSLWAYASTSSNPGDALALAPSGGSAPAAGATSPTVPSESLQGQPQSPSQAEATQNCLESGSACPATVAGPSPSAPHWWRGLLGLAILGSIVAVLVAAVVVVAERRRMPPPVYPNAGLYPPGTAGRLPSSGRARGPDDPPAPADDDPLGHLW